MYLCSEVGGKNKGFKQIKGIEDSYVVSDDIDVGHGKKIPLWLFGLLYWLDQTHATLLYININYQWDCSSEQWRGWAVLLNTWYWMRYMCCFVTSSFQLSWFLWLFVNLVETKTKITPTAGWRSFWALWQCCVYVFKSMLLRHRPTMPYPLLWPHPAVGKNIGFQPKKTFLSPIAT